MEPYSQPHSIRYVMDLPPCRKLAAMLAAVDADFLVVYLLNNLMSIDSHVVADSIPSDLFEMIYLHSHSRATMMSIHVAKFLWLQTYCTMFPIVCVCVCVTKFHIKLLAKFLV